MNYEDGNIIDKESSIAKLVMNRIRKEDKWAFTQTDQMYHISISAIRWLTALGIIMLSLCLLFLFNGMIERSGDKNLVKSDLTFKQVVGVGEIGYADSSASSIKSISVDDMVASIGEAFMLHNNVGEKSLNFPLLIAFFIFFEVLLLMNWVTRNVKS